jgi:hypothetical protein
MLARHQTSNRAMMPKAQSKAGISLLNTEINCHLRGALAVLPGQTHTNTAQI